MCKHTLETRNLAIETLPAVEQFVMRLGHRCTQVFGQHTGAEYHSDLKQAKSFLPFLPSVLLRWLLPPFLKTSFQAGAYALHLVKN
jgi:hypothetical protein